MKKIIACIILLTLSLSGCEMGTLTMSEFEKFAYEGCVAEGKYSKNTCSCNAANLDKMLTIDEKNTYKRAALGDMGAAFQIFILNDKLMNAILQCAN